MIRTTFGAAAGLAAALVLTGCTSKPPAIVPAEGMVVRNNQPVPHAFVQFVPMIKGFGAEYIASATTDENGRYKLECNGQPGACACETRVTVMDGAVPDKLRGNQKEESIFLSKLKNRPIPSSYASVANTPLVINVTANQTEYVLDVSK